MNFLEALEGKTLERGIGNRTVTQASQEANRTEGAAEFGLGRMAALLFARGVVRKGVVSPNLNCRQNMLRSLIVSSPAPRCTVCRAGRAFTLIELLVVMAIIAILMSIMVPVVGAIRNRGNQTTSINNLKQWGTALSSSLADFDGTLPSDGVSGGATDVTDTDAWFNRLASYVGEKPLSDPETAAKPPKPGDRSVWVNPAVPVTEGKAAVPFLFCYAMNDYLSTTNAKTIKMSRVERNAATVFMSERADGVASILPTEVRGFFGSGDSRTGQEAEANFLFLDGHVISMKRKTFLNPDALKKDQIDPSYTFIPYADVEL